MPLSWTFFAEASMTSSLEHEIRHMLVDAFPDYADFFATVSYRGSVPEFRLIGRQSDNAIVAHLECGPRVIEVGQHLVRILGIGAVAVHPTAQGLGVGQQMFSELVASASEMGLADFGFLQCREAVAGFYQKAGFNRVYQLCTSMHHDTHEWETRDAPVMVMPIAKPITLWPSEGAIHLKGYSW
jgi:nodulation protein A